MSGYLYITEHDSMPEVIKISTTRRPIEEVVKESFCTHLWRADWPKNLELAIHKHFEEDIIMEMGTKEGRTPILLGGHFNKDILSSLHLFIDAYLKQDQNFSRKTRELLQATKDKRPTRSEMSLEERKHD